MGATRKLQGEIDRVLNKVQEGVDVFDSTWNKVYDTGNANQIEKFLADLKKEIKKLQRYRDQIKTWMQSSEINDKKALMDAHKLIEREVERFKFCVKETKTKAFSKEGPGQQLGTDPKEEAKVEARGWLNNTVSELESQVDCFEAEMEGLSVKKGKENSYRLTLLESSITRHKAHIMKLEWILRLLDNDELSPEQLNSVRQFFDDYVERNQEDFDEFEDVDMLYSTLSLDKVDTLEDLDFFVPPDLVKVASVQDKVEETDSSDHGPKTPTPKGNAILSSSPTPAGNHATTPVAVAAYSILQGQSPVKVQQQSQSNTHLNMPPISGGNQQSPLLQQFNSESSTSLLQGGLHGASSAGPNNVTSAQQPPSLIHLQSGQRTFMPTGSKDTEIGNAKADEMEQQQSLSEDSAADLNKKAANEEDSQVSYALDMQRYTLKEILSATNNFSHKNLIVKGPSGKVYSGQLSRHKNLVIQRLDFEYGQGHELQIEISTIKRLEHKNVVSSFGYCVENNEKIIIYEAFHGTLHQHLSDPTLTWSQRLQICLGVARALNHIHYDIIHCDISSSKIILDENWDPKIYGFELSTRYPQSWRHRLLFSRYFKINNLTPKYDVYSFGVLLLEVLCGRKPMITNNGVEEELEEIIDPNLRTQMDTQALALFTNIAYKCLNQQHMQRPTMDQIIKELEEVLELQWEHADLKEHSVDEDVGTSSDILKIPLREIRRATNGFNKACFVGSGGYADVYKAKLDFLSIEGFSSMEGKSKDEVLKINKTVAVKRILSRVDDQGKQGFLTELELLSCCKHPNIVSLLGFSREGGEMILVYEYAFKGSLGDYLVSSDETTVILTWAQRIKICLDIATGINYLHTDMEGKPRIIHRDIKSDNILLDENMNAKLADFGLSKSHPTNQQPSTIYTKNIAGTTLYMDPEFLSTGKYKRESDIYSFGVVLFEVLSGRVAYDSIFTNENQLGLAPIARRRFTEGTLKELIDPKLIEDDDDHMFTLNRGPNQDSFHTFSKIAYQCLAETQSKRPTINAVIKELQYALKVQGEAVVLSRPRLSDIVLATENFAETYCIGSDTIGTVYKIELDLFSNNNTLASEGKNSGEPSKKHSTVAIKRITSRKGGQGKQEFFEEIDIRTSYQHPNIVPLLGFCDEGDEMILVYECVSERSLKDYLKSVDKMDTLTWTHRLHICLEIARGLNHLHTKNLQSIIHIDIKNANILLDEQGGAKIAYFVSSKLHKNKEIGMKVYKDPEYKTVGKLKTKSDVYSFGVVLFEILCGRLAYDPVYIVENNKGLVPIVRQCFIDGTIERIMDPNLKAETDEDVSTSNRVPNQDSLDTFLKIAYQCLGEAAKRPTMEMVIKELELAINFHDPKPVEYR